MAVSTDGETHVVGFEEDWESGGDPFKFYVVKLNTAGDRVWTASLPDESRAVAVADGTVLVATSSLDLGPMLHAFDSQTGELQWRRSIPFDGDQLHIEDVQPGPDSVWVAGDLWKGGDSDTFPDIFPYVGRIRRK